MGDGCDRLTNMRNEQLDAQLKLALVSGIGPRLWQRLHDAFGDASCIINATNKQLQRVEGIGPKLADQITHGIAKADTQREWALMDEHRVRMISLDDAAYPTLLKHIHDPPPLLFVRGELQRTDSVALAVVGSRRCTAYGRDQADRLAAACAQSGMAIISGGARGIDTAAHRAALRAKGRTMAVLGCGLSHCYPPENKELFDTIVAENGAVISELPMSSPPIAENFPRRNRIISGMSLGVLVVEAAKRSGALITARLAAEEHHREVLAVPGRIDSSASEGCHQMIREGWAALVTSAHDILDSLGETGRTLREASLSEGEDQPQPIGATNLNADQARLLDAIDTEATSLDALATSTGLSIATIQAHLTTFQLRGLVERVGGNQVRRRAGAGE